MGRKILLESGADVEKLAVRLNVSERTVRDALKGDTGSVRKKHIRYTAVREFGGYYSVDIKDEGVVTVRDGHIITHFFYGKDAKEKKRREYSLRIDTKTGEVKEYVDNELNVLYGKIPVSTLLAVIKRICSEVSLDYEAYFGAPKI